MGPAGDDLDPGDLDLHEHGHRIGRRIALFFAVLMHLSIGFFYAFATLVAPPWAVFAILWPIWIVLAITLWRVRRSPWLTLGVPFVAALLWWAILLAGDWLLGWTA